MNDVLFSKSCGSPTELLVVLIRYAHERQRRSIKSSPDASVFAELGLVDDIDLSNTTETC